MGNFHSPAGRLFFNQEYFFKICISDHSLEIEKGRYNKTPREENYANIVAGIFEDEAHFILKCKVNQNMRESLFNNIELDNEIFLNFSDEQKLVYLLNPASVQHVRVIGFYLKRSLELRTEVLL
jgi:hypothetical protein